MFDSSSSILQINKHSYKRNYILHDLKGSVKEIKNFGLTITNQRL